MPDSTITISMKPAPATDQKQYQKTSVICTSSSTLHPNLTAKPTRITYPPNNVNRPLVLPPSPALPLFLSQALFLPHSPLSFPYFFVVISPPIPGPLKSVASVPRPSHPSLRPLFYFPVPPYSPSPLSTVFDISSGVHTIFPIFPLRFKQFQSKNCSKNSRFFEI